MIAFESGTNQHEITDVDILQNSKHEAFTVRNTLVYDRLNPDFHLKASLATTVPQRISHQLPTRSIP